ncbi:MAG: hypothetical protein ACLFNT_15100 [Spirochaetales bacterium]
MSKRTSKKPFFKRVWVWVGVAVVLGGIALTGGEEDPGHAASPSEGRRAADTEESAGAEPEPQPSIGDVVVVGDIEWLITEAETGDSFEGEFGGVKPGSTRTTLVRVAGELTNTSNEELSTLGNLKLVDTNDTEYGEHEDAVWAAEPLALDSLNPNVPKTFSTIFEVPRDVVDDLSFKATSLRPFSSEEEHINLELQAE